MSQVEQRIVSPQRSRSIKLKVPNKMFPQDFFRRSSSQSPQKNKSKQRYLMQSPEQSKNPEASYKSQVYWDIMREELQKHKQSRPKQLIRPIQRIWVYSQKKHRPKLIKNEQNKQLRHQSRQQKSREFISENNSLHSSKVVPKKNLYTPQFKQGLFTFFGKPPSKVANIYLPPIK